MSKKQSKPVSFWDGLPKALRARGLDPYTARVVSAHVQEVFVPYAEAFQNDPEAPPAAVAAFNRIFIGT